MPPLPQIVKVVTLTEQQVRVHNKALAMVVKAIEAGEPIKIGVGRRLTPEQALRNLAGWLQRQLDEQNGGKVGRTAWDFQEER